jgi:hypothetical protein
VRRPVYPQAAIARLRIPVKAAPTKAIPAVFARQSVSVTTYFAEGFFRRISIRNDTVVVESTSATAAEKGSRENRGVPRNAAAAANHIFTVFPIEALNIR